MRSELDRFFDEFLHGFEIAPTRNAGGRPGEFAPRVDISETDEEFRVTAELPGLDEGDFEVSLEEDVLTIKGEKKVEEEEERKGYTRVETSRGSFHRAFRLPLEVDPESVTASYKKGVLTVTLPKPPEAQRQPRVIPITAS
jgi:HSP20 family protein